MVCSYLASVLLLTVAVAGQQNGDIAENFICPENNGKFADPEQCDLFYICRKGVATIEYCPEGLLFDITRVNHEKCVLPHNVDCGDRQFVQEPSPDSDPKCPKANGVFDHDDPAVCNKYIQCDNGRAFEFPCPDPLVFDVKVGSCVRSEQKSELARVCDVNQEFLEVDGFSCPGGGDTLGPQNLLQAHPIYAHPTDCQYYFSCYHNKVRYVQNSLSSCDTKDMGWRMCIVCDSDNGGLCRSQTSLVVPRATCLTPRPKCANWPRK